MIIKGKTNTKKTPVWKDTHSRSANDMNRNITTTMVIQDDTEKKVLSLKGKNSLTSSVLDGKGHNIRSYATYNQFMT